MLRFTQEQQALVLANRTAFNTRQASMVRDFGLDQTNGALIGNASPLPRDVWGVWDREAVDIQREVLSVFNDLASSVAMPMPIGKLVHHFRQISDSGNVNVSLDGRSKARTDQPTITYQGTPVPILDSTFSYGWRQMEAARTEGFMLDDDGRTNAMYKVAEQLETQTLDGDSDIVVGGSQLYGLRNHPKRETRSITSGVVLNGATGAEWLTEVKATLKLLHDNNFRVPATLYVNWDDWFYAGNTDFSTSYPNKTIAQRVLEMEGVGSVVPASKVSANEIIAVVKNRRVVQVLSAMPMVTRAQFRANPEDDYNFATMAAAALEIKYDATDQCGLAHTS
jgi:hypothetical protein